MVVAPLNGDDAARFASDIFPDHSQGFTRCGVLKYHKCRAAGKVLHPPLGSLAKAFTLEVLF